MQSLEGLRSAHGFLQRRVASELTLKHTPTLTFEYDDSVDRGMRITADTPRQRRCRLTMTENGDRSSREQVLERGRAPRRS